VIAQNLERWFIGHACELASAGMNVGELRRDTVRWAATLEVQGRECLTAWLSEVGA